MVIKTLRDSKFKKRERKSVRKKNVIWKEKHAKKHVFIVTIESQAGKQTAETYSLDLLH